MSSALQGIEAKLDRADKSLRTLDRELARISNGKPLVIGIDVDFQSGWNTAYIEHAEPLPPGASIFIGESLYHGRSALEHLVWALVKANRKKPGTHNSFPIWKEGTTATFMKVTNRPSSGKRRPGPLVGVSKQARTLIESSQPYNGMNPPLHVLALLNRMAIDDRHHALHAAYMAVWDDGSKIEPLFQPHSGYRITDFRNLTSDRSLLVDGAKLARFRVVPLTRNPKVSVKGDIPIHIAFGEPDALLLGAFKGINKALRGIIEPFAEFL
ncbi:MAG: hypothetical protein H0X28_11495 [Solirubrobacterales bacterium]|nr:hypothetical protein [Solirubrobacterales bacterium]